MWAAKICSAGWGSGGGGPLCWPVVTGGSGVAADAPQVFKSQSFNEDKIISMIKNIVFCPEVKLVCQN